MLVLMPKACGDDMFSKNIRLQCLIAAMETQTALEDGVQGVRANQSNDIHITNVSTEENKAVVSVKTRDSHDGLISIIVTPQASPDSSTHKSLFRSETNSRTK